MHFCEASVYFLNAVRFLKRVSPRRATQTRADLAAAFQSSAIEHIVERLQRGLEWCDPAQGAPWATETPVRCLVLSGGVASNTALRTACADLGI